MHFINFNGFINYERMITMMKLSEVLKKLETYSCFSVQINYGAFNSIIRDTCMNQFRGLDSSTITFRNGDSFFTFPNVKRFTFDGARNQYVADYCDLRIRIYDIK